MKGKSNPIDGTKMSFLKKIDDSSKYGLYVEMCYKAMEYLDEHKGYVVSDNKTYERNYIICLSYIMGKNDGKSDAMSGLIVGGDGNKYIFDDCFIQSEKENEQIKKTKKILGLDTNYVAPDFVIHKNNRINDIQGKYQKIIVEAKTTLSLKDDDFYRDFFKLNVYLNRLKFRYGIYLLINTSIDDINCFIKGYIDKCFYISEKCKNRMLFLIQEKECDTPSLYQFKIDPIRYLSNNG